MVGFQPQAIEAFLVWLAWFEMGSEVVFLGGVLQGRLRTQRRGGEGADGSDEGDELHVVDSGIGRRCDQYGRVVLIVLTQSRE